MMFHDIKVASAEISNVYFKVIPYYYGYLCISLNIIPCQTIVSII